MADSKAMMNGSRGRTRTSSSKKRTKNEKDGIFLKQPRQHLRRWRFARNARRAKRQKHREARYRRNHPWPYWNKCSSAKRDHLSKNDIQTSTDNDNGDDIGCKTPTAAASALIVGAGVLVMALEAVGIGIGIVHGILSLITCAMSLVIAVGSLLTMMPWKIIKCLTYYILVLVTALQAFEIGLGIVDGILSLAVALVGGIAKVPWIVLKCLLHRVNDYILTPPAMEEMRKTKLEFYAYMICLPFLPCWASTGQSPSPEPEPVPTPHTQTFTCSACGSCKCWDGVTVRPIENGKNDFCRLDCPEPGCKEDLVQCRHCSYNFKVINARGRGSSRRSEDGLTKKKMAEHLRNNKKCKEARESHKAATSDQPESLLGRMQGLLCDASSSICDAFDCGVGGGGFLDEEEEDSNLSCNANHQHQQQPPMLMEEPEVNATAATTLEDVVEGDASPEDILAFGIHKMLMEQEEKRACSYIDQFQGLDLDPNSPGEEDGTDIYFMEINDAETERRTVQLHHTENDQYNYSHFSFLDSRDEVEKKSKDRRGNLRLCQNQLYMYQKYLLQKWSLQDAADAGGNEGDAADKADKRGNKEGDATGGFAGLLYRANKGNREDFSKLAYPKEARVVFRLLNLLLQLSEAEKEGLIEYQEELMDLFKVKKMHHGVETIFPSDINAARRLVLSGPNSILKNFPVQRVFEIPGHACVSLLETIRIAAGHGLKFNFLFDAKTKLRNEDGLNGTEAATDLFWDVEKAMKADGQNTEQRKNTNVGCIYFWSDSFLRCFIKQKENSVWILTVTICPPESEKSTGMNTFVLAMGKSGEDHTKVIEHYINECQSLMKGFDVYFGETNEIGRMAVSMLTWNADRPERQMISNTKKEGTYGLVSGWAVNVSEEKFPSCVRCHRRRVLDMIGGTEEEEGGGEASCSQCGECLDWTLDPDPNCKEQMTDRARPEYPKGNVEEEEAMENAPRGRLPGQEFLGPIKLSTAWMRMVVRRAYNGMRNQRWSKKTTEAYLQSCNVGGAVVDRVTQLAKDDLNDKTQSEPSEYEPKFWCQMDCFERFRLPDLPMHALAHGIIPDVMEIVHSILTHYKKYSEFINFANKTLDDVASFGLDYCKLKSLPKAAWVGENSMAYMRLMSYIYGMYFSNYKLSSTETEKTRETVRNVKCMLNALQALMSVLMSKDNQPDESTVEAVDNHMKVFMSSANRLHRQYGSLSKKATATGGLVGELTEEELISILVVFGNDDHTMRRETKARLMTLVSGITVPKLQDKCKQLGLDTKGLKLELQQRLFGHVIGRAVGETQDEEEGAGAGDNAADGELAKDESMCWKKGNWLSFTANIASQIEYLGMLLLIW